MKYIVAIDIKDDTALTSDDAMQDSIRKAVWSRFGIRAKDIETKVVALDDLDNIEVKKLEMGAEELEKLGFALVTESIGTSKDPFPESQMLVMVHTITEKARDTIIELLTGGSLRDTILLSKETKEGIEETCHRIKKLSVEDIVEASRHEKTKKAS